MPTDAGNVCFLGYSLDNVLLRRNPVLAGKQWFRWAAGSLPMPQTDGGFRTMALAVLAFVVIFDVGTYNYYRGSVLTPFHGGPVSPTKHHLTLSGRNFCPTAACASTCILMPARRRHQCMWS
jgi:thiosulfate dehydrogenase (quinone)